MTAYLETFTLVFALALFLGGGAFWAFVAAPAIFSLSPSREVASRLAAAMTGRFDRIGQGCLFAIGGIELLRVTERANQAELLRGALASAMLALGFYAILAIRPAIARQRAATSLEPPDDGSPNPSRRALGRLHGQAYLCLLGQLTAGALLLALVVMP